MKVIMAQSGLGRGFRDSSNERGDETSKATTAQRVPNSTTHRTTQRDVSTNPNSIE